jgi:large subunit ribosomal protein L11
MAKKKIATIVKINIKGGEATPAPPVGTALGPHGVNIMEFCKAYNSQTEGQKGSIVPAEITVFEDRSFTFVLKTPPTSFLIMRAAGVEKGVTAHRSGRVGKINRTRLQEIAQTKMGDLNAIDLDGAMAQVAGTAKSMGIEVGE